jgi:hypothetical protein
MSEGAGDASGNAINAVLAAAGSNFRRLLARLRLLLLRMLIALGLAAHSNWPEIEFFTDDGIATGRRLKFRWRVGFIIRHSAFRSHATSGWSIPRHLKAWRRLWPVDKMIDA